MTGSPASASARSTRPAPTGRPVVGHVCAGTDEVLGQRRCDPRRGDRRRHRGARHRSSRQPRMLVHAQAIGWDRRTARGAAAAPGTDLPLYFDNGAKTLGAGRDVVRRGARRPARRDRAGRLRRGRRGGHQRRDLPGRDQQRRRVGPHHDRVRRPAVPLRRPWLPGGVRRGRGDPRPLPAGARRPTGARRRRGVASSRRCSPPRRPRPPPAGCSTRRPATSGPASANLVNLFNPERIVLGGWAGLALGAHCCRGSGRQPRRRRWRHPYGQASIELCVLGPDAVAFGAATLPHGGAAGPGRRSARATPSARAAYRPPAERRLTAPR